MKVKNTILRDTETSEPDTAGILDSSQQEFKATIINMLRALGENVDSVPARTDRNVSLSRGLEILRKDKKEISEVETATTKMKGAFNGLMSRLNTAEAEKWDHMKEERLEVLIT